MNILAMNNTVFYEEDSGLYVYKETGKFFTELKELGNEIHLFQISERMVETNTFANYNLQGKGLRITNIRRGSSKLLSFVKAFFHGISAVIKADVIYVFYPGPICAFIALCALIGGKKYGLYIRGEQGITNLLSKVLYKNAEILLTVSPRFTDEIGKNGAKAFTIRPMIRFDENDIDYNRQYIKRDNFKLLFVGRIVWDKGIFEMVQGLKSLSNTGQDNWTMDIIGDGPDLERLKKEVIGIGLDNKVTFQGNVSEKDLIKNFYKKADLFLLPSHHEGFPRVLYEAMIFGVPIVTTFVGAISTLMEDGINCHKINVKDQDGITQKVGDILKNYSEKALVAVEATKTIKNYLSDKKDSHAVQLHKLLHKVENKTFKRQK